MVPGSSILFGSATAIKYRVYISKATVQNVLPENARRPPVRRFLLHSVKPRRGLIALDRPPFAACTHSVLVKQLPPFSASSGPGSAITAGTACRHCCAHWRHCCS